jgi:hypothetical protein
VRPNFKATPSGTSLCCRPLCNAHTTGTDVLWAGLPMVTLPLEKMATRVAMSLCHAPSCGEEMVVSSMQEYEERAVMLATHPTMLRALTAKLRSARLSCPLFDTTRWVIFHSKSCSTMPLRASSLTSTLCPSLLLSFDKTLKDIPWPLSGC